MSFHVSTQSELARNNGSGSLAACGEVNLTPLAGEDVENLANVREAYSRKRSTDSEHLQPPTNQVWMGGA